MSKVLFANVLLPHEDKITVAYLHPHKEALIITEVYYHKSGDLYALSIYWREPSGRITRLL